MTTEDTLITPEARAMIARETPPVELGEVTLRDIQRYAMAVQDYNPLYFDEEAAKRTAYGGLIAPPNMLSACMWGTGPREDELAEDGTPARREQRVPLKVTRAMGGGQELTFLVPVRPGDRFTRTDRVVDVYEREGRAGTLAFVVTEQIYKNHRGEVAVICRQTSIFH